MRLIDADALMYAVDGNPLTTDSLKEYVRSTVKAQPTVDAIPVEWLLNHQIVGDIKQNDAVLYLVNLWRKENGSVD